MTALMRMRLAAYVRTQVAFAPSLAALVVLGIFYGGGQAQPEEAYGVSAVVLFPILAWQAKILLDVEPDVQRAIAVTALGSRVREIVTGIGAAFATAVPLIALAFAAPWALNAMVTPTSAACFGSSVLTGLWVHLLAVPPAVALGAISSRAIVRSAGNGAALLVSGFVLALVLGLKGSPVPWLMPPLMAATRVMFTASGCDAGLPVGAAIGLTVWSLLWGGVVMAAYTHLRRTTRP
jgi:hypothetical protein